MSTLQIKGAFFSSQDDILNGYGTASIDLTYEEEFDDFELRVQFQCDGSSKPEEDLMERTIVIHGANDIYALMKYCEMALSKPNPKKNNAFY
jgi:hypothetical protein